MATPFTDVFDLFLTKITDSQFLSMDQTDMEDYMTNYLMSSIPHFRQCQKNLYDYNSSTRTFNDDLSIDDKEILATWMLYEYLGQNVFRIELMKQGLSQKDFKRTTQAKQLEALETLRKDVFLEASQMIIDYNYYFGKVDDLR